MTLSDRLIVENMDLGDIKYMQKDNIVYIKESDLEQLTESENVNLESIFEYIVETHNSPMYSFKMIRDRNIPGVLAECYVPEISEDSILTEFAIGEVLLEDVTMSDEKMWVFITKSLSMFKKGNYKEAPSIEYRLKVCQREIKTVKDELEDLKKQKDEDYNTIRQVYAIKFIIKSLIRLGITAIRVSLMKAFKIPADNKMKKIIKIAKDVKKGATTLHDIVSYKKMLSDYLYELEKVEEYLQNEVKNASARDDNRHAVQECDTYVNESLLEENFVFSKDNLYINFDKFENKESNICFVTGLSGSGKSTLAPEIAKKNNAKWIELDIFISEQYRGGQTLEEALKNHINNEFYEYLYSNKSLWESLINPIDRGKEKEKWRELFKYIIKWCNSHKENKWVLEGVQIFLFADPEEIKKYPIIFVNASMLKALVQRWKRNTAGKDHILKELRGELPWLLSWYIDNEKKLQSFQKAILNETCINNPSINEKCINDIII